MENIYRPIDWKFKQDFELYAYWFANGTLCLNISTSQKEDYRALIANQPHLFWQTGSLLVDRIKDDKSVRDIKQILADFIFENKPSHLINIDPQFLTDSDKNIFTVLKRFLYRISTPTNENESKWFKELTECPSGLQLTFCVWGNNVILDHKKDVMNEKYVQNRAMEFIHSWFDDSLKPAKEFEPWEKRHNT